MNADEAAAATPVPERPEQTAVGCFVRGGYRDDCLRFVDDLKRRAAETREPVTTKAR